MSSIKPTNGIPMPGMTSHQQLETKNDKELHDACGSLSPLKALSDNKRIFYNSKSNSFKVSTKSIFIIELFKSIINFLVGYKKDSKTVLGGLEKNINLVKENSESIQGEDKELLSDTLNKVKNVALTKLDKRVYEKRIDQVERSIDEILYKLKAQTNDSQSVTTEEQASEEVKAELQQADANQVETPEAITIVVTQEQISSEEEEGELQQAETPETVTMVVTQEKNEPKALSTPEKPIISGKENKPETINQKSTIASNAPKKEEKVQLPLEVRKKIREINTLVSEIKANETKSKELSNRYKIKLTEKQKSKIPNEKHKLDNELKHISKENSKLRISLEIGKSKLRTILNVTSRNTDLALEAQKRVQILSAK